MLCFGTAEQCSDFPLVVYTDNIAGDGGNGTANLENGYSLFRSATHCEASALGGVREVCASGLVTGNPHCEGAGEGD